MSASPRKPNRAGRPRGSSAQSGFRITPVWQKDFDRTGFARALLLLAMHLDEQNEKPHKQDKPDDSHEGGGRNEQER